MGTYLTVDRSGTLKPETILELRNASTVANLPQSAADHLHEMFPAGLSRHGERYSSPSHQGTPASPDWSRELLFEYVRRESFRGRPSRFQSAFACQSIQDCLIFMRQFGKGKMSRVFEVAASSAFLSDMNCLRGASFGAMSSLSAKHYCDGKINPFDLLPFWELVLPLPVTVLRQVELPDQGPNLSPY